MHAIKHILQTGLQFGAFYHALLSAKTPRTPTFLKPREAHAFAWTAVTRIVIEARAGFTHNTKAKFVSRKTT
jgi:hypothetical protein